MIQLEYYFSLLSPWSYLGHERFTAIVKKHKAQVILKPIPIMKLFNETGGTPPGQRHASRQAYRIMELKRYRDKLDIPLNVKPAHWPYDVSLAHGVVFAMIDAGQYPKEFIHAAFKACWADDLNMGDEAVVASLIEATGGDANMLEAAKAIDVEARQDQNLSDSIAANVFGAPGYVWGGEVFWGQDRVDLLGEALDSGREPYNADVE